MLNYNVDAYEICIHVLFSIDANYTAVTFRFAYRVVLSGLKVDICFTEMTLQSNAK